MDDDRISEEIFKMTSKDGSSQLGDLLLSESPQAFHGAPPPKTSRRAFLWKAMGAVAVTTGLALLDHRYNHGYLARRMLDATGARKFVISVPPNSPTPLERYAALEERLLEEFHIPSSVIPRHTRTALSAGDEISNRVARALLRVSNQSNAIEIAKDYPRDQLMILIAKAIAAEGIFYHSESLLSRAFNPSIHEQGRSHMDCDLLTYLMIHVGQRLGVPMHPMQGPMHAYLFVPTQKDIGYLIEPTEFRRIEVWNDTLNYSGEGVGPGYFTNIERQRKHGGIKATATFEADAGFHRLITDPSQLEDSMLTNIIEGLMEQSKQDISRQIALYQKLKERVSETRSYILAHNAYGESTRLALEFIRRKDLTTAQTLADDASEIRKRRNNLIIVTDPIERTLQGLVWLQKNDPFKALAYLEAGNQFYANKGYNKGERPHSIRHADLLCVIAAAKFVAGYNPLSIYDDLIVPVHNAYAQSDITQGMYFDLLGETYQKVQQHPILKAAQILKDLEKN